METVLLVVIVVLGAALVVVSALTLNVIKGLRSSVKSLEKRVESLHSEVAKQQENLEAVSAVLQRKQSDPFSDVLQAIDRYRSRGLVPAVAMVGIRLFKSYLSGRARKKAMPVLGKSVE